MAKRHQSLIRLSQDHHHALALALRLRQGNKALLNDGWTHDRIEQASRLTRFYENDLRPHFSAEEKALFPVLVRAYGPAGDLVETLLSQHRQLELLIARTREAESERGARLLVNVGELLEEHIRLEERKLFPLFESHMTPEIAGEVGAHIAQVLKSFRDPHVQ